MLIANFTRICEADGKMPLDTGILKHGPVQAIEGIVVDFLNQSATLSGLSARSTELEGLTAKVMALSTGRGVDNNIEWYALLDVRNARAQQVVFMHSHFSIYEQQGALIQCTLRNEGQGISFFPHVSERIYQRDLAVFRKGWQIEAGIFTRPALCGVLEDRLMFEDKSEAPQVVQVSNMAGNTADDFVFRLMDGKQWLARFFRAEHNQLPACKLLGEVLPETP